MIKEKNYHCLPGDMGGGGIMKKWPTMTQREGGSKLGPVRGDVIYEWPIIKGRQDFEAPKYS